MMPRDGVPDTKFHEIAATCLHLLNSPCQRQHVDTHLCTTITACHRPSLMCQWLICPCEELLKQELLKNKGGCNVSSFDEGCGALFVLDSAHL